MGQVTNSNRWIDTCLQKMTAFLLKIGKRGSETMIYQIRWQSFILQILDINIKMSKEKRTIEIAPGLMSPGGRIGERFLSRGHVCTYCQGNGYLWQEKVYRERYKQECPVCKGSGRLDAVVTIEWKAGE